MLKKEQLLTEAREHLDQVATASQSQMAAVKNRIIKLRQRINTFITADGKVDAIILANNLEREKQLRQIIDSPYFVRCDAKFTDESESSAFYIGKFQFSEANVYSWVSPIAQLRFGAIGQASYKLPNGEVRQGEVLRKDQFMIVGGKLIFMSSESATYDRTLIHQEHLTTKKNDFALPEIIARMEQAQDEVIRADYAGSFLIAGPAGSGKTTLAFHRLAYLNQSPDTAEHFPGYNMIVFVQDEATKKYFSAILPQLGIEEVKVVTFEQWALKVLELKSHKPVTRFGADEPERNEFEYYKNLALKHLGEQKFKYKDIGKILLTAYREALPLRYQGLLIEQLQAGLLDRFDLTVLLRNASDASGNLVVPRRVVVEDKYGKMNLTVKFVSLSYAAIVVDEAENYLAEQIEIIKSCANTNRAVLYVGDLAQQTKLGTIQSWSEVGEDFTAGRKVMLDKIYRSTKEILEYIRAQDYAIEIPAGLKNGPAVEELKMNSLAEASRHLTELTKANPDVAIGVLYEPGEEDLANTLKNEALDSNENVKFLSFNEAQGVEFEVVIILKKGTSELSDIRHPAKLVAEQAKIKRDLWYVALTRSMNILHIVTINNPSK